MVDGIKNKKPFILHFAIFFAIFILGAFVFMNNASAAVPYIFSYQGRLYDNQNNLLGASGATFYFRFSIWDNGTVGSGTELWPAGTPSITTSTVEYGVFNVLIGDTASGGDPLTLDFNNSNYYLQIEVASQPNFSDGETLSPRQRIVASGFALNSDTLDSYHAAEGATGTEIPVLTNGNLILGGINPQIDATSTYALSLQGQINSGNMLFNVFSGSVGIGTSTPAGKVHIVGNDGAFILQGADHIYMQWYPRGYQAGQRAYAGFSYAGSNDFTIANDISGGSIILSPNNGSTLLNPNGGNVGIGTFVPSSRLEIFGGYATSNLGGGDFGLHFASGGPAPDHSQIWWGDNTGWKLNFGTKDAANNFVPRVTFTDTGYVGIGTSTPSRTLDVRGNSEFYGDMSILPIYNSTSSVKISDGLNTEVMFSADTYNNRIKIGDNDPAGNPTTIMVLDSKIDAGDPAGANGAMYYNSITDKFRCYESGAWKDCDTAGGQSFRSHSLLRDAVGVTMTNASIGGTEITNLTSRTKVDLSGMNQVRAQFSHSLNSLIIKLRIDFSTDNCATWNATPLVAAFGAAAGANNNQTSAFDAIPAAAKTDVCIRAVIAGNGSLDPVIRYADIDVK